MGRGWDIQAGHGPSETGRATLVAAELRANQETKAQSQCCYWTDLEGIQNSGHTGDAHPWHPSSRFKQDRGFLCETLSTQLAPTHPPLIMLDVSSSGTSSLTSD